MAITWGSKVTSGSGNYMRLGYEFSQSPSSVGTGTSSVTVTLKVYVNTRYPVSDSSNSFSITGDFSQSGSENIDHSGNDEITLLQTETRTVNTSYTATVKSDFSASLSGINAIPGTASVSGAWTTGKRPIDAPWAPNSPGVTRNSDTSHTIFWTNDNPTAAAHPYENLEVQRWDNVGNAWSTIATLGVVSSYTNTSTRVDRQYRWRVRATNDAGNSAYVYTGYWSTTPDPPSDVHASKSGNDIPITWTNHASKGTGVEVWHATNGVWDGSALTVLSGTAPNQPTTYTHLNPDPTKTHQYRLKCQAGTADDAPTTYSAYSTPSNIIQLLTNPAAPTKLSPASGVRDAAAAAIVLTWQHNEVDGTAQTKYDLQYRLNGGSWTTVSATTGTQSRTFAAGTLPNGSVMDWQVRTYGQYATAPAYSPWSAAATLTLSATPQAGVVFPDDITPVATSRITAQWSYYDEEATAQAQWKVKLYTAGGAQLLETRTGVGTDTSAALTTLLQDATSYRVGVEVQDGSGLWSPEATQDFTVAYALPDTPTLTALWDPDRAAVNVSIGNPTGGAGAPVDHNEVWRSVDWLTYELVATDVPPNGTITDYIPVLGSENVYLVVAVTAIEASAQSEPLVFETPELPGWFIINGGDDFSEQVRVGYNPNLSREFSRDKTLNRFAGREYPVETAGEQRTRVFDLSVSVFGDDDSTLQQLEAAADLPAPLVLRTPLRDRMYVSLAGAPSSRTIMRENVSLKLTQVDAPNLGSMPLEPVVYRTNMASNPSFESADINGKIIQPRLVYSDTALVTTGGGATADFSTQWADSGAGSMVVSAGTSSPSSSAYLYALAGAMASMGVELGKTYTASATVYLPDAQTGALDNAARRIAVGSVVAGVTNFSYALSAAAPNVSGSTTRLSVTFTVPVDAENMFIRLMNGSMNEPIFWDSYVLEEGETDGSYFDGDIWEGDQVLEPRWTGTPNASPSELTRGGTAA